MRRVIEITNPGRSVHKDRGFLAIRESGQTLGRVPLDDIDAVIAASQGITWSGTSLAALAERSVPVVFVGKNFAPIAHILPLAAHHNQGEIMQAQADTKLPLRKRLWADIVRRKISAQQATLQLYSLDSMRLARLKSEVTSGDPDNREAAAAQYYWRTLFGDEFSRDRVSVGSNTALNYGYAILRAATARAIVAAGLNPSLSIHHVSGGDALRLADDLMEPFRPAIDITVKDMQLGAEEELTSASKTKLAAVIKVDYATENGRTPLSQVVVRLAQSLARVYLGIDSQLDWPRSDIPLPASTDDISEEVWDSALP